MGQSITNVFDDGKSFALLTFVSQAGLIDTMDVREIRLERLRKILAEKCGGVIAELARRIDKSAPQVRVMLNPEKPGGRWIGEKIARAIEHRLSLPRGWLDQEEGEIPTERLEDRPPVIPEDLWASLPPKARALVEEIVSKSASGGLTESDLMLLITTTDALAKK